MNAIAARMDFEQAVAIFNHAFNPNNRADVNVVDLFRITQSDLRLEQPLTTGSNTMTFPVLDNQSNLPGGGTYPCEIRLSLQDSFVPTKIGIFQAVPSNAQDTAFDLYPYFSPLIFPDYAAMEVFYNGRMKWTIQNDVLVKNWMTRRHKKTNQTQQTAAWGAGSPLDQRDGDEDGFIPMQPFVLLQGSQAIDITINLPQAPVAATANARTIIIVRGLVAQNSTVVN